MHIEFWVAGIGYEVDVDVVVCDKVLKHGCVGCVRVLSAVVGWCICMVVG